MKSQKDSDPAQEWVTTLSWTDMVIALCLPRFFKRYAPEEIQQQWAEYLERRGKHPK